MSDQQPNQAGVTVMPEHIRESLKSFKNHKESTCLECGYTGLMGVKKKVAPWYLSWWTIVIVTMVASVTMSFLGLELAWWFTLGYPTLVVLVIFRLAMGRTFFVCPNCKTTLVGRGMW